MNKLFLCLLYIGASIPILAIVSAIVSGIFIIYDYTSIAEDIFIISFMIIFMLWPTTIIVKLWLVMNQ